MYTPSQIGFLKLSTTSSLFIPLSFKRTVLRPNVLQNLDMGTCLLFFYNLFIKFNRACHQCYNSTRLNGAHIDRHKPKPEPEDVIQRLNLELAGSSAIDDNAFKLIACIPFIQLPKLILTAIELTHSLTSNNYTRKLLSYEYNKLDSLQSQMK